MNVTRLAGLVRCIAISAALILVGASAQVQAQAPQGGAPPAVGVVSASFRPMAETTQINGRIKARERVDLIARVTAFIDAQNFVEGTEVKKGDLLYSLERAPFEADVEAKQAAITQAEAQLENAKLTLGRA